MEAAAGAQPARAAASTAPRATTSTFLPGISPPARPHQRENNNHLLAAPLRTHTSQTLAPPDFPLIAIGASTGGPRVVHQILSELPRAFPAEVLVIQHIAAGFSLGMAEWLSSASALPVRLAKEGHAIRPGEVLVAPDQRDLLITPEATIHLNANPLLIQRPSIDVTMQAAAEVFGAAAIGVLLTGMGRDGAYGMLTIRRSGGHTIAQDEASSAIFGMPRAAIQLGAAAEVLPYSRVAARLCEVLASRANSVQTRKSGI
jgi:two-component system chemotaxis response regulator CheB